MTSSFYEECADYLPKNENEKYTTLTRHLLANTEIPHNMNGDRQKIPIPRSLNLIVYGIA